MKAMLLMVALIALTSGCKRSEAATMQSRELFANACARCHGADGAGGAPLWDAGPSPQNFRDHAFHMNRTDDQLKQTIKNGKGIGMPAFGTTLDDDQIAALVLQIRSFDGEKNR